MKTVVLPEWHYAAGWPAESTESVRPLEEVTEMGCRYAATKDSGLLLEICQCFHPYLMKYLTMISRGHLPVRRGGEGSPVNRDVEPFIRYFLPKGTLVVNRASLARAARHFHLAFKNMQIEEIYDILMVHLIAAINGYDPCYKAKVKQVVEVIHREFSKQQKFSAALVGRHVEFDGIRILRMLVRAGFLETVPGEERERMELVFGGERGGRHRPDTWKGRP